MKLVGVFLGAAVALAIFGSVFVLAAAAPTQQSTDTSHLAELGQGAYPSELADAVNYVLGRQEEDYVTHAKQRLAAETKGAGAAPGGGAAGSAGGIAAAPGLIHPPRRLQNDFDQDIYWSLALSGNIRGLPCVLIRAGWWSYEMCWGRYVRQFHEETVGGGAGAATVVAAEYLLGWGDAATAGDRDFVIGQRRVHYANNDGVHTLARKVPAKSALAPRRAAAFEAAGKFKCTRSLDDHIKRARTSRVRRAPKTYEGIAFIATMSLGTKCDLTGGDRETDVIMVCEKREVLFDWNVTETQPCRYTVFTAGRAVCSVLEEAARIVHRNQVGDAGQKTTSASPQAASSSSPVVVDLDEDAAAPATTMTAATAGTNGNTNANTKSKGPSRYTRDPSGKGDIPQAQKDGAAGADAADDQSKESFEQIMMGRKKPFSPPNKQLKQQQSSPSSSVEDDEEKRKRAEIEARELHEATAAAAVSGAPASTSKDEQKPVLRKAPVPSMPDVQQEFFEDAMMFGLT